MGLMYNTQNDRPINRNQLAMIPTPEGLGRFHHPYPFGTFVDDVEGALDRVGIEVRSQEYAVTKDHQRMFGIMEIGSKRPLEGELITSDEWSLLVGLRGSHDQKVQRGLVIGSSVLVCSNLCFHGNVGNIHTKQTTYIETRLPGLIRSAVEHIPQLAHRQERVYDAYHNHELKPRAGDAALVEIYRRDGLSSAQLGRAIDEWHEPSFDKHEEEGFNVWRLMQATTQALKPTGANMNMETIAQRTGIATTFMDEVCHIDF